MARVGRSVPRRVRVGSSRFVGAPTAGVVNATTTATATITAVSDSAIVSGTTTATATVTAVAYTSFTGTTANGDGWKLWLPRGAANGTALVHFAHPADGDHLTPDTSTPISAAVLAAGWALVATDYNGNAWGAGAVTGGNSRAVETCFTQADAAAKAASPVTLVTKLAIGYSMGLITLVNAFRYETGITTLVGLYGTCGVFNLADLYAGAWTASINTAYNIPTGGTYATQTSGRDPNLGTATQNAGPSGALRFRYVFSAGDEVCHPDLNAAAFVSNFAGLSGVLEASANVALDNAQHLNGYVVDSRGVADFIAFGQRAIANADAVAPPAPTSAPTNVSGTLTSTQNQVTWLAPAAPASNIKGWNVYVGGVKKNTSVVTYDIAGAWLHSGGNTSSNTTWTDTTNHPFLPAHVGQPFYGDYVPPGTTITAVVSSSQATLSQATTITNNVDILRYAAPVPSFTITGLSSSTGYTATIRSVNFDGVESADSSSVAFTTAAGTTLSPAGISPDSPVGAVQVTQIVAPAGVSSGAGAGTATLTTTISVTPVGTSSAEISGVATVTSAISATPNGVASNESFGVPTVTQVMSPSGVVGLEAAGAITATSTVALTGIATGTLTGVSQVTEIITPAGVAGVEVVGAGSASSTVPVIPTGIPGTELIGAVTTTSVTSPAAVGPPDVVGAAAVTAAITLAPLGTSSGDVSGSAAVAQIVSPAGVLSSADLGAPALTSAIGLTATAIVGGEVSGVVTVVEVVSPTAVVSAGNLGSASVATSVVVPSVGTGSGEMFGTASVVQVLTPAGFPSGDTAGAVVVSAAITLTPTGLEPAVGFGAAQLISTVTPASVAAGDVFGATAGSTAVSLAPPGIASGETSGSSTGSVSMPSTGIRTGEAFGSPSLAQGPVGIGPAGIGSGSESGAVTVTTGAVMVTVVGVPSGDVVGAPLVVPAGVSVSPTGVASTELVGSAQAAPAVSPSGSPSGEALGAGQVVTSVTTLPAGVPATAAFGSATVAQGPVATVPTGIPGGEQTGSPNISTGTVVVSPTGIGAEDVIGPVVTGLTISPRGVEPATTVGAAGITVGALTIAVAGIPTVDLLGASTVTAATIITPVGITAPGDPGPVLATLMIGVATVQGSNGIVGSPVTSSTVSIAVASIADQGVFGTVTAAMVTVLVLSVSGIPSRGLLGCVITMRPTVWPPTFGDVRVGAVVTGVTRVQRVATGKIVVR